MEKVQIFNVTYGNPSLFAGIMKRNDT